MGVIRNSEKYSELWEIAGSNRSYGNSGRYRELQDIVGGYWEKVGVMGIMGGTPCHGT